LGASDTGEIDITGDQCRQARRAAADKDGLDPQALIFEETFGHGDTEGELIVPGKTDEDCAQVLFFLGRSEGSK
jgi:hypothetical protein